VESDDAPNALRAMIADGLAVAKRERELTQSKVAAAIGVEQTTVSAWKVGKSIPDLDKVRPIADVLVLDYDELLRLVIEAKASSPPRPRVEPPAPISREEFTELSQRVARLDEKVDQVLSLLHKIGMQPDLEP